MASPPPSSSNIAQQLIRKDWSRLDYLLKSAPPCVFRVGALLYPVTTKCRPLCLVPPPELQPRRIYLLPELEMLKFDHYRSLVPDRAARLGLDLTTSVELDSRLSWHYDDMEHNYWSSEHDQRDCTLRSSLNSHLDFIGWQLGSELGYTRENGEGFRKSCETTVQAGDFPMIQSMHEIGSRTRLLLIELTTLGAGERIFGPLEEDLRKGGEDGVGILDITGDVRCLIHRAVLALLDSSTPLRYGVITDGTRWMTIYKHDLAPSSTADPNPPFVLFTSPFLPSDAAEPSFVTSTLYALINKLDPTPLPPSLLERIKLSLSKPASSPSTDRAFGAATVRKAFLAQPSGSTGVEQLLKVSAFAVFFDESPSSLRTAIEDTIDPGFHVLRRLPASNDSDDEYLGMLSDIAPTTEVRAEPLSLPLLCVLQPLRLKHFDSRVTTHFTTLVSSSSPDLQPRIMLRYSKVRHNKEGFELDLEAYIYEHHVEAARKEDGARVPRWLGNFRGSVYNPESENVVALEWWGETEPLESWEQLETWQKEDLYATLVKVHAQDVWGSFRPRYVFLHKLSGRPILTHFVSASPWHECHGKTRCRALYEAAGELGLNASVGASQEEDEEEGAEGDGE